MMDYLKNCSNCLDINVDTWYGNTYLRRHPGASKEEYIAAKGLDGLMDQASDNKEYEDISEEEMKLVVEEFLHPAATEDEDVRENYRFQEFCIFNNNASSNPESEDRLCFHDIQLPESLLPYLHKIQQVETLGVTTTQINFSRVSMPQPRNVNGHIEYPNRMKIFKGAPEDVLAMPATQSFGEGLFFD